MEIFQKKYFENGANLRVEDKMWKIAKFSAAEGGRPPNRPNPDISRIWAPKPREGASCEGGFLESNSPDSRFSEIF